MLFPFLCLKLSTCFVFGILLYRFVFIYVYMYTHIYLFVCITLLSNCTSKYIYVYLCLPTCSPVSVSAYQSICNYLSACVSAGINNYYFLYINNFQAISQTISSLLDQHIHLLFSISGLSYLSLLPSTSLYHYLHYLPL